jgi:hypothetical protein
MKMEIKRGKLIKPLNANNEKLQIFFLLIIMRKIKIIDNIITDKM